MPRAVLALKLPHRPLVRQAPAGANGASATPSAADLVRDELVRANRPIAFFACECGDPACVFTVPLTARDYDRIRPAAIRARVHR
jgi:hypothetical protein